jgi:hypothetical protein
MDGIMEKILGGGGEEITQIEDKPTEGRMEDNCENIAPLLKFVSGCGSVKNVDMQD